MTTSPTLSALGPALVAAQGELRDAAKTSDNPHFKSKYADLAEVLQTARPVLSKHGLALIQTPGVFHDGKVQVTTMLLHGASGEYVRDTADIPVSKPDAQGVGGAITYGRRYGGAAIIGMAQDDDDGESAVGRGGGRKVKPGGPSGKTDPDLIAAIGAATSADALRALAPRFAAADPATQAAAVAAMRDARARLGLP